MKTVNTLLAFSHLDHHTGRTAVRGNLRGDLAAAANVELVIKNGNVFTQAQILAPFRTAGALEARARALEGYAKLCAKDPQVCADDGSHAH